MHNIGAPPVGVFIAVIRLKGTTRAGRECPPKSCYASECALPARPGLGTIPTRARESRYNCTPRERSVTRLNTFFGLDDR